MADLSHPNRPSFEWRGGFSNAEINRLHAECFEHPLVETDWWAQVTEHSLGWVCMRTASKLVGFVNVAWDGGAHAFLLDAMVAGTLRRGGYASRLVAEAVQRATVAGCEWLHVDFEPHLRAFYLNACGFKPTDAGLIALR